MKLKKPIFLDAAFLTVFVFLFIFLVSVLFPIKLKVFHPIKDAFSDFDYTDFYFSKLKKKPDVSSDIIVVNIGHLSRAEIAHQLEVVKSGKPKVIGLDAIFYERKDQFSDSLLGQAIKSFPNLVGINKIDSTGTVESFPELASPISGYGNFYGDEKPEKVIRYFSLYQLVSKHTPNSFGRAVAQLYDSSTNSILRLNGRSKMKINYRHSSSFITVPSYDLFDPNFNADLFHDKIVLMGYTGQPGNTTDMEDQHFTPMNSKIAGKSLPDMKGIYIHACIIQSLIDRTYIRNAGIVWEILLTLLFTFLTAWLIIHYYVHKPRWFHLMSKMVQLFAGVIFLFVSIWIMDVYHVKINFTLLFVTLVLCADLVYFYDPLAKWLHKKNWFHSEIMNH